ncbi:hypothetical protein DL95DRAFT_350116 [Leptodontidium sp. 2 PMI_412]|nr:hypothetical protein DL95DRAFT_350116 [Leptodontidium sp. 2 PMI_412]
MSTHGHVEFPHKVDLVEDLYRPFPIISRLPTDASDKASDLIENILVKLGCAMEKCDVSELSSLFFTDQAYWRDTLALTYHLRTFKNRDAIASALLELGPKREVCSIQILPDSPALICAGPTLSWIESMFTFNTRSPRATCQGKVVILPEYSGENVLKWKIWTLATWLVHFDDFPEDDSRLKLPSNPLRGSHILRTEVLIIGAGNSGLILAARLKTLAIDYILIDKNRNIGDNWALRYDNLRFHVPKSFVETPYIRYPDEAPNLLHRDDLAEQMRRFAKELNLEDRVLLETTAESTSYDSSNQTWSLKLSSGKVIVCKHLVLATGILSSAPHVPAIESKGNYHGVDIHSIGFQNGALLKEQGVKSVIVVGSANTAFDVVEDCYNAGLHTTMIQRSPTYVIPITYWRPEGLGMYDRLPAEVADSLIFSAPVAVGGQMLGLVHAKFATQEPDRYSGLAKAGFLVTDSTQSDLMAHLFDRLGGHYVDTGGTEFITSKKVGIRSGVTPLSYTTTGLQLSDGSALDSDAIIWCTGFRDLDVRTVVACILGEGGEAVEAKMETTWGLDCEGETRGMFKRQSKLRNFWVMGGGAAHHRWYSKALALQIKGALEGVLPEAYLL